MAKFELQVYGKVRKQTSKSPDKRAKPTIAKPPLASKTTLSKETPKSRNLTVKKAATSITKTSKSSLNLS